MQLSKLYSQNYLIQRPLICMHVKLLKLDLVQFLDKLEINLEYHLSPSIFYYGNFKMTKTERLLR